MYFILGIVFCQPYMGLSYSSSHKKLLDTFVSCETTVQKPDVHNSLLCKYFDEAIPILVKQITEFLWRICSFHLGFYQH